MQEQEKHHYYIISFLTNVRKNKIYNKKNIVKKNPKQTVNVEYSSKKITIGDQDLFLQLWDTAGQERFKSVTKSYYKNAVGVIIVFDLTK